MDHPNKKHKVGNNNETYREEVLFNTDTLSKIISYLPSLDVLSLAVTCKRFGYSNNDGDSLIEESTRIAIQEIATEEQLAALPFYNGGNSLADYHYLQLLRQPLTFDQLVNADYVNEEDKSCVEYSIDLEWATSLSNNVMRAGKHYVTFEARSLKPSRDVSVLAGVMRPGQTKHNARGFPHEDSFFRNFSRSIGRGECNNNVHCCMYYAYSGKCCTSDWSGPADYMGAWDGMENMRFGGTIGMLLDLDEGTLSVYINGRKLGVMKRGLAGAYCWVVSLWKGTSVTIKRGAIPPS